MVNSETFNHNEEQKIATTSATMGLLRKELISNLGMTGAKAFLLKYGWNLGVEYAKEVLQKPTKLEEMLNKGEILPFENGQILKMVSERTIETDENGKVISIFATGKWTDSYEVKEHLKNHEESDYPVCYTLAGLVSGFTSLITKRKVYVKEVKCRAMGHDECCYEMRMEEEWQGDTEMLEEIKLYNESSFIEKFNFTNKLFLDQREYLEKVSTFQAVLTAKLAARHSIEEIVGTVSKTLEIPVSIEDLNFKVRIFEGIKPDLYNALHTDFINYISCPSSEEIQTNERIFIIRGKLHNRLVTPIVIQNETMGYMSFIYSNQSVELEKDMLFLQLAASSAAIYFLTEKASGLSVENVKGYFLEQLLLKQYSSGTSMIYRGYLMGIDLKEPFYLASLEFSSEQQDVFYDQVMQSITRNLDLQSYPILATVFNGQIVMLLPKVDELNFMLESILNHLNNAFRHTKFRFGISNVSESIECITESLEEAQSVLKVNNQDPIVFFENANIIGTLINSKNMSIIRRKAQKEIQPILQLKAGKRHELLKTMYIFLRNGGNLQQTISDLSLSMSGLMYRISKIEKLLNKELRNPITAYELLLMLDALKILGDIDVT